eukprot:6191966-Pleurochrysis_carterae.AAC.1
MSSEPSWNPSPLAPRTKVAGGDRTPCPSLLTLTCPSNPTNRGLVCRFHISRSAKAKGAEREEGAGLWVARACPQLKLARLGLTRRHCAPWYAGRRASLSWSPHSFWHPLHRGGPASVRSVRLPYALPGPRLRGAHVRALAARRSSVPQAHAPLLVRARGAPRRTEGGRSCSACRCKHWHVTKRADCVRGGSALWVTLAMLAGTPYYLPASLAASKLRSYMTPGVHPLTPHTDARRWA